MTADGRKKVFLWWEKRKPKRDTRSGLKKNGGGWRREGRGKGKKAGLLYSTALH